MDACQIFVVLITAKERVYVLCFEFWHWHLVLSAERREWSDHSSCASAASDR